MARFRVVEYETLDYIYWTLEEYRKGWFFSKWVETGETYVEKAKAIEACDKANLSGLSKCRVIYPSIEHVKEHQTMC